METAREGEKRKKNKTGRRRSLFFQLPPSYYSFHLNCLNMDPLEMVHRTFLLRPTSKHVAHNIPKISWARIKGQFELFLSSTVSDTTCLFALDFLTLTTAAPIRGYGSAVLIYKVEERKAGLSFHASLSLCVCGNSTWSPLTAVQQGSHDSTSEWLLIEWEMKRTVVVPVQCPPPPVWYYLVFHVTFFSSTFTKSPSPHKETRSSDVLAKLVVTKENWQNPLEWKYLV